MRLTAIILTLNEQAHITACLQSVQWADAVCVFDSLSADDTVALAQQCHAQVIQHRFENYAQQRNAALEAIAPTDWVLFLDADERATPELAAEIRCALAHESMVGYYLPRHNYIFGKLTLGAGYYPDYQLRLFRYGCARYERPVEEVAVLDGPAGHLRNPLIHYNYTDAAQFHSKQQRRAHLEVAALQRQGIHPRFYHPVTIGLRYFWWRYVALRGWRDGWHGLRLCGLLSYYYGFLPYYRLWRG